MAIDRTSRFAFIQLADSATRLTGSAFLEALVAAVPYRIHTLLTDNGIQFRFAPRYAKGPTARYITHMFAMRCPENGIEHRFTEINHPWTNGQVERINRTTKDATVKRFHYDSHDQLRRHLDDFGAAYNFARRLKRLRGLTPYEFICKKGSRAPPLQCKPAPPNAGTKQRAILGRTWRVGTPTCWPGWGALPFSPTAEVRPGRRRPALTWPDAPMPGRRGRIRAAPPWPTKPLPKATRPEHDRAEARGANAARRE